uniref:Uncharacterized protein n=1 Tax=Arundo donax TaxID=35708 RepID=A0A0A9EZL7_ARUDO
MSICNQTGSEVTDGNSQSSLTCPRLVALDHISKTGEVLSLFAQANQHQHLQATQVSNLATLDEEVRVVNYANKHNHELMMLVVEVVVVSLAHRPAAADQHLPHQPSPAAGP